VRVTAFAFASVLGTTLLERKVLYFSVVGEDGGERALRRRPVLSARILKNSCVEVNVLSIDGAEGSGGSPRRGCKVGADTV
jgi:hypothetical protein